MSEQGIKKLHKAGKLAQDHSQLMLLQIHDGIVPCLVIVGEVDRARALVASARRGLGRLGAGAAGKDRSAGLRTVVNADRRSAPRGRPRSPRGPAGPGPQRPTTDATQGLAASAAAAIMEVPNGVISSGGNGATTPGFPPRKARGEEGHRITRATSKTVIACEKEQRPRRAPASTVAPTAPALGRQIASSASTTTAEAEEAAATQSSSDAAAQDPSSVDLAPDLQEQHMRQRVLLAQVLRKCALLQDEIAVLRDDLTRKDVIIHGLRQEVQAHRQEAELQHQQFEHQQQQLQHQHQVQQLQQLQQLQELQRLLQQQQMQLPQQLSPGSEEASLLHEPASWEQSGGSTQCEVASQDGQTHVAS
mmetsp:Transcript_59591/g.138792  ORF Transcript_59591/g.138792 Transcript_59591/m.138792 type:complete len:362 (+) Transcript_59591:1286-2371(+)